MNDKGIAPILILLIVAIGLAAGGIWYYEAHQPASQVSDASIVSGGSTAVTSVTATSAPWGTFTNPEDFYSIQYPNLGTPVVSHAPIPPQTIIGWNNRGDFDVIMRTVIPANGLHVNDWIKTVPSIIDSADDISTSTINGMETVIVKNSDAQMVSAYIEQDFYEGPLLHVVEFQSNTHDYTFPPFWQTMLQTFRGLPWQG
jgi:hypothetical protein